MAEEVSYTYAGIEPVCGGWRALMVDCEDTKKDQPKELARWIRGGLIVSRVLTSDINSGKLQLCKCERPKKAKKVR